MVPATSIYPQTQPTDPDWPFMRWDGPSSLPIRAACVPNGATVSFMIHAFSKGVFVAKKLVKTAEDHCGEIVDAAHDAIDGTRFTSGGASFRVTVPSTRLMRDGAEQGAYHGILNCVARVLV